MQLLNIYIYIKKYEDLFWVREETRLEKLPRILVSFPV
jgi:hypothetical protein